MPPVRLAAALLSGAISLAVHAAQVKPPKIAVKPGKAPPLGKIDPGAVKDELFGEVRSHVSLCAAVHALRQVPCASQALLQKIVPQLLPIEVSHVGIRKQDSAEIERLVKDGRTEAPPPELQKLPWDLDVSLKIGALQVAPAAGFESLAASGKLDLIVTAPKVVKTVRATITFSGTAKIAYAPQPSECHAMDGGDSIRIYPHLSVVDLHIDTLSTDRVWWAKLLPGDRFVKWVVNHLLGWGASALERRDARATAVNAGLGLDKNPHYPLGFPICLGKGPCGPPAPPQLGWATAKIGLGKIGSVQYAKAGSAKPYLLLSSSQLLCDAFEIAKSARECVKPLFEAVMEKTLPLTLPIPKQIARAAIPNPPALDLIVRGVSLQAADGAYPHSAILGSFKAAIGDHASKANAPFEIAGTGEILLGAVCDQSSFYLWNALALDSLSFSSAVPAWLTEGLGRAAVNAHLPAIDVCLGPAEVDAYGGKKKVDVCQLGANLAASQSAGTAADAALDAILPLQFSPAKLAKPALAKWLEGITVSVTSAKLATGKTDSITAAVAIKKSGQPDSLDVTATVAFSLTAQCKAEHGQLHFVPDVTELSVPHLPNWLVQSTLLKLANDQLAKAPPLICIQGACKNKPRLAVKASLPAPAMQSSTGCDAGGAK